MTERACAWCGVPFTPRTNGGKPQRFCSEQCRVEFHRGCRVWAEDQVWRGLLSVSALKNALEQRIRSSERPIGQHQSPRSREREPATERAPRELTAGPDS